MQVRVAPHVVNHYEDRPVAKEALKLDPRRSWLRELRITPEQLDPGVEAAGEGAGGFTNGDPQDAAREGVYDPRIMTDRGGEGRLPEAACALQSGGNGDGALALTEKRVAELTVLMRSLDEALGTSGAIMGAARGVVASGPCSFSNFTRISPRSSWSARCCCPSNWW